MTEVWMASLTREGRVMDERNAAHASRVSVNARESEVIGDVLRVLSVQLQNGGCNSIEE
jgi:hypothetical protein